MDTSSFNLNIFLFLLVVPSTPVNLAATVGGSRTITASWQEGVPLNPVNTAILSFEVYLNDSLITSILDTTVVLDFLTPFTDYRLTVAARNRIGTSNMSNPVVFMTDEEGMYTIIYAFYIVYFASI